MTSLAIIGGVYPESCPEPSGHVELLGSAGRAARCAAALDVRASLDTCVDEVTKDDVRASDFVAADVLSLRDVESVPSFRYRHALSRPDITRRPANRVELPRRMTSDEVGLRFGMLEATAVVDGTAVVYDPQSAFEPESFHGNGSSAQALAVVANDYEARYLTGASRRDASDFASIASRLLEVERAQAVVLKAGAFGAWVADPQGIAHLPCRRTPEVWPLGSGDVFATIFAIEWGVNRRSARSAAEVAVRGVAHYVATRTYPSVAILSAPSPYDELACSLPTGSPRVYLAAPFFTMAQRWLLDELRAALPDFLDVFSPLHEIGRGPAAVVAPADLAAIDQSAVVLAVLDGDDPGTLFEVGYARSRSIPVIVLAETSSEENLVMFSGSDCTLTRDVCTAIYHTVWQALMSRKELPQ